MSCYAQHHHYHAPKPEDPNLYIVTPEKFTTQLALGVRSGVVVPLGFNSQDVQLGIGLDEVIDFNYQMKWYKKHHQLGFLLGVSLNGQRLQLKQPSYTNSFSVKTDDGVRINYTVDAKDIAETRLQLMAEVPLMFALQTQHGFFLNVGPRVAFPVWSNNTLSFSKADVNAYFPDDDVNVENKLITGKVQDAQSTKVTAVAPLLTIKAGVELGYAISLDNRDLLDIGVYCDWSGLSIYQDKTKTAQLITITPPSEKVQPAQITYGSLFGAYAKQLTAVNAGLKLCYRFNL